MSPQAKSQRCLLKHLHQSRGEAGYCDGLLGRVKNGQIAAFAIQHSFPVSKTKSWKADFVITDKDGLILEVHEYKGFNPSDDNFRLKLALFFERYADRWPVFVNNKQVFPSKSGHRIMNLPPKKKRKIPSRPFAGRR